MAQKPRLFVALLLALGLGFGLSAAPPNVVLIISDDQHWGDYGFMGHSTIQTPHLDRLSKEGLTFRRGYVPSSLCCPSLASIITGRYPHEHLITGNDPPRPAGMKDAEFYASETFKQGRQQMVKNLEAWPTLPRVLGQAGYRSLQTGKWWLGDYSHGGFTDGMTKGGRHGDQGLEIGRKTLQPIYDFIARARKDGKPFFIWYAPMMPHDPHTPPERILSKYRDKAPSEAIAKYWGMVEWFDETCGDLLNYLDREGLAENTLVLYLADNGWITDPNTGRYAPKSKQSPYDGGLRTPIMVHWTGRLAPKTSDVPVSSLDLFPTILKACGVGAPGNLPGVDLTDDSSVNARHTLYGECFTHDFLELDRAAPNLRWRWILEDGWKLILPAPQNERGPPELYYVVEDPLEGKNLAASQASRIAALRTKLDALWPGAEMQPKRPEPRMIFLENGEVRMGMDLSLGGAVTFLSSREHPGNLINSFDLGRQIQMSHYSGPWPFEVEDKKPRAHWAGLGWNPIQTGDDYLNPSKVIEHRHDGHELYIKCIPMQWPLDNVPGDCTFETWTTLDGPLIRMRFRCTNQRLDKTFYRACAQELPAVYTISALGRVMSYTGDRPFTGGALTHLRNDWRAKWPWTSFVATERWAALVDTNDWGLGVFKDDAGEFHGGISCAEVSEDPMANPTAYLAPIQREHFDHNIVYEHQTLFMVGRLQEIRRRFNDIASKTPPAWTFEKDRQHWTLLNATDQGLPLSGEWVVRFNQRSERAPRLLGPTFCWRAEQAKTIELQLRYTGKKTTARLLWTKLGDNDFKSDQSLTFELVPDAKSRVYRVDLAAAPTYGGLITGLALDPVATAETAEFIAVKHIKLLAAGEVVPKAEH